MNKQEIEKAIDILKSDIGVLESYLKNRPACEWDSCFENELIKDLHTAISALQQQLNNGWIPAPPLTGTECLGACDI